MARPRAQLAPAKSPSATTIPMAPRMWVIVLLGLASVVVSVAGMWWFVFVIGSILPDYQSDIDQL